MNLRVKIGHIGCHEKNVAEHKRRKKKRARDERQAAKNGNEGTKGSELRWIERKREKERARETAASPGTVTAAMEKGRRRDARARVRERGSEAAWQ